MTCTSDRNDLISKLIKKHVLCSGTLLPPAPPVPISSLNSTYLQPAAEQSTSKEDNKNQVAERDQGPAYRPGGNFFSQEEVENPEDRSVGDFKQIVKTLGMCKGFFFTTYSVMIIRC